MRWLGRRAYRPLLDAMRAHADAMAGGEGREEIWFCEHDPVYTTGRRGVDNRRAPRLPAPLVRTDRGGETTFHGPGQLICYPLLHLRRRGLGARDFVHLLEESCIRLLASLGVAASRRCGFPGVWVGGAKIAALGVRIRRGIGYHGIALNVAVDAAGFAAIRPCGLDRPVANLADHVGPPPLSELAGAWHECWRALLAQAG